jgi:REP element-mobilizing transposase RayT
LTSGPWIYSGSDYNIKIQHLLISGHTYGFKVANPETLVVMCQQLKMILCSVIEEKIRNWDNDRVVVLLNIRDTSREAESQILFHVISNNHFHLLFSKREVKEICKRLYKNRRLSSKKGRSKSSNEVPLVFLFNDFFQKIISFCIWEFNDTFEQKRRLFQCYDRVDLKSFSEFIETNFIKNQIFECTELFSFLKNTPLPLNKTSGNGLISLTNSHGLLHSIYGKFQLFLEK